jgi:hypothetical protein
MQISYSKGKTTRKTNFIETNVEIIASAGIFQAKLKLLLYKALNWKYRKNYFCIVWDVISRNYFLLFFPFRLKAAAPACMHF